MSGKDDAFVRIACKCPICTRESRHRYVKSKLYQPVEIEGDQHVVAYKWEAPRYEGIRPNFYHIWHCPFCHFCDEKEVFRGDDDSGGKLELIREKLLIAAKAPRSFIMRMGGVIDLDEEFVCLEGALAAHLQAIYIQEMLSPNMRQYAKLGRYYLRTAWLYREKTSWNVPETRVPEGFDTFQGFFESLQDEWPEIPLDEKTTIARAASNYQNELDRNARVDDVRYEISIMFLLVDLYQRMEGLDAAIKLVRNVFQQATRKRQSTRHALDNAVNRKDITAQQIESMRSLVTWLNNTVDRANNLYEDLNDKIFEEEYPRAREVVAALEEPSVRGVLEKLRAERFHEVTCKRIATMFSKGVLAETLDQAREKEQHLREMAAQQKNQPGLWGKLVKKLSREKDGAES